MRYKNVMLLVIWVALCWPNMARPASPLSISRFVATADHDERLTYQAEKISFLKQSSSNTPFLNEVELRTRIDEFASDKQRYAIRLKPNGWGESRDGQIVYHATLAYNEAQQDFFLNEALRDRYTVVIDYLNNQQLIALNEALMALYEDRVNVLKQSGGDLAFDPNDLIDAENEIIQLELELINLKNKTVTITDEIRKRIPVEAPILFDTADMIGIKGIETVLTTIGPVVEKEHVFLKEARIKAELSDAWYQLEKSENRKYISFIEAAYDTDDRNDFEKAVTLQFGIAIPFINPNRLDANRRKLESLKDKNDYLNLKVEVTQDVIRLSRDEKRLIHQHEVLTKKLENSKTRSSFDMYRKMDGVSPLILLKLRESILKTDITMAKIMSQIYEKYIRLLAVSGKLTEKPLKNYLSSNLEVIAP